MAVPVYGMFLVNGYIDNTMGTTVGRFKASESLEAECIGF